MGFQIGLQSSKATLRSPNAHRRPTLCLKVGKGGTNMMIDKKFGSLYKNEADRVATVSPLRQSACLHLVVALGRFGDCEGREFSGAEREVVSQTQMPAAIRPAKIVLEQIRYCPTLPTAVARPSCSLTHWPGLSDAWRFRNVYSVSDQSRTLLRMLSRTKSPWSVRTVRTA